VSVHGFADSAGHELLHDDRPVATDGPLTSICSPGVRCTCDIGVWTCRAGRRPRIRTGWGSHAQNQSTAPLFWSTAAYPTRIRHELEEFFRMAANGIDYLYVVRLCEASSEPLRDVAVGQVPAFLGVLATDGRRIVDKLCSDLAIDEGMARWPMLRPERVGDCDDVLSSRPRRVRWTKFGDSLPLAAWPGRGQA
jgi:hypothetical protein